MNENTYKIAILPLDDRPCHYPFLAQACFDVPNYELRFIEPTKLAHFYLGGDLDAASKFLLQEAVHCDALIVSIDALLYGGLVQAREFRPEHSLNACFARLSVLKEVKKQHPTIKIYAYSILIRLSITIREDSEIEQWEHVFEYSRLAYLAKHDASYQQECDTLVTKIKPEYLSMYLQMRERNHKVNCETLQFVKDGYIDYLGLPQEDAQPYGLQIDEQHHINELIKEYQIENKVLVKNGTDEMACLLLARCFMDHTHKPIRVFIEHQTLSNETIALYEDRPIYENLCLSLQGVGITLCGCAKDADIVMVVLGNDQRQVDLCFEDVDEYLLTKEYLKEIEIYKGKQIAILDICYANGGSVSILEQLLTLYTRKAIIGYSAWNTASNSIGTLVLDCVVAMYGKTNQAYVNLRMYDDAIYQGKVRKKLCDWLKSQGKQIWNPDDMDKNTIVKLQSLMNDEVTKFQKKYHLSDESFRCDLPWSRTFEIDIYK